MRQLSIFLLVASAAVPAFADPGQESGRANPQHRDESAEQTQSRSPGSLEGRRSGSSERRAVGIMRLERSHTSGQDPVVRIRPQFQQQQDEGEQSQQAVATQPTSEGPMRIWRRRDAGSASTDTQSSWRPRERNIRTIPNTQPVTTQPSSAERSGFQVHSRRDYRDGHYPRWSASHWRSNHRYDWRHWRDRHRSRFHLGFYFDPFGWSYRRWPVGSFIWPRYYRSRFWLHDPWHYRLPPAYGPYRWVRYWDDALLVNIYTGEVVDVIHNFFW